VVLALGVASGCVLGFLAAAVFLHCSWAAAHLASAATLPALSSPKFAGMQAAVYEDACGLHGAAPRPSGRPCRAAACTGRPVEAHCDGLHVRTRRAARRARQAAAPARGAVTWAGCAWAGAGPRRGRVSGRGLSHTGRGRRAGPGTARAEGAQACRAGARARTEVGSPAEAPSEAVASPSPQAVSAQTGASQAGWAREQGLPM